MTRIGIGVTTTPNRQKHLEMWYKQFDKFKPKNYHLHIHDDAHYKGVAHSKNNNLYTIRDADYIFLFDDDCFPIKDKWWEYFIESGQQHLLYLQPSHGLIKRDNELEHYMNCGGVFMFMTKKVVETVGYFGTNYGRYGFEHAGYSNRIFKAGLTDSPYQQLKDTGKYIFAIDYDGEINGLKHKSSISEEDKQTHIENNRKVFIDELKSNDIFVNFEFQL
jgi:hypothetical protein